MRDPSTLSMFLFGELLRNLEELGHIYIFFGGGGRTRMFTVTFHPNVQLFRNFLEQKLRDLINLISTIWNHSAHSMCIYKCFENSKCFQEISSPYHGKSRCLLAHHLGFHPLNLEVFKHWPQAADQLKDVIIHEIASLTEKIYIDEDAEQD